MPAIRNERTSRDSRPLRAKQPTPSTRPPVESEVMLVPPRICDANSTYQSDDADFTIVSSDDWEFRVHTYQLMATSMVFRNMIGINTMTDHSKDDNDPTKCLEMTDSTTEGVWQIRFFLDWLYGIGNTDLKGYAPVVFVNTLQLLKKYDCEPILKTFNLSLEITLYKDPSPFMIFVLAAHLEDNKLCARALEMGKTTWTEETGDGLDSDVKGASVFDLTAMSDQNAALIPIPYQRALLRATRQSKTMDSNKADWKGIAAEFQRLLQPRAQ